MLWTALKQPRILSERQKTKIIKSNNINLIKSIKKSIFLCIIFLYERFISCCLFAYWLKNRQTASWYFRNILISPPIYFFQFKFLIWFSGLLNRAIDSDIKVLKSRTFIFNACKWPRLAKKPKPSLKMNQLNQRITKFACLTHLWRKHKPKYWWNHS